MSKTDKTTPWRVVHARGECRKQGYYLCSCFPNSGRVKVYRRKHQRHERTQLRLDLAAGREPETQQHRHQALWEAW